MIVSERDILDALARAIGVASGPIAVSRIADAVRSHAQGEGWSAWVARATRIGIREVVVRDLNLLDGLLVRAESGDYTIHINSRRPPARRLFSLAHEIAHYALEAFVPELGATEKNRSLFSSTHNKGEERAADRLAAEMLMPVSQCQRIIGEFGPSLRAICGMADEFRVSLQAAAYRLKELSNLRFAMFRFLRDSCSDQVAYESTVAWNLPFRAFIPKPWALHPQELALARISECSYRCVISLPVAGGCYEWYPGEIRAGSRSWLVFPYQRLSETKGR